MFAVTSPLLDACVLAVLSREDAYGYALNQEIRSVLDISESTLYPILRRLQRQGALRVYDQPYQGRNRRYYALTEVGRTLLTGYRAEWLRYRNSVEALLSIKEGVMPHDQ